MVIKNYNRIWIITGLLLAILFASECRRRAENKVATKNISAALDSVKYYKNRLNTQTATIKTLVLDKKSLQQNIINNDANLSELSKEFASVNSVVQIKEITKIDTVFIPFKDIISLQHAITDSLKTSDYSFKYKIDSAGLTLKNLVIPNEITILTGHKRKWLLGSQTLTTDVTNSNPYITTERIMAAELSIPEPLYKKWYIWLAAGFVTGALIK